MVIRARADGILTWLRLYGQQLLCTAHPEPPVVKPAEVQRSDRVADAVEAIRATGTPAWFEPTLGRAKAVAAQCPECRVYAPVGHLSLVPEPEPDLDDEEPCTCRACHAAERPDLRVV
ncbi:MAG TPA: hypothetical protein PLD23_03430 [Armatimonadota bacterium]|nr:hypothetical protein [Armatimonadota bacterium]HQK92526.1 hypothetical protein [Armatimonadota bacterium]